MILITINEYKRINEVRNMDIFEGENVIDCLHVDISKTIGKLNVTGFSFFFDYINEDGICNVIQLNEFAVASENENYLSFEYPITNDITALYGKIKYWIRIIDASSQLVAKTAEREIIVKEHTELSDYISTQTLTLLDQWQVYMDTTYANTLISEGNALLSEQNAKASEDNAKISEDNAKASEVAAKTSETNAKTSETQAALSQIDARTAEASTLVSEANTISYAVGGTGTRENENTDNAKYYKEQSALTYNQIVTEESARQLAENIRVESEENRLSSESSRILSENGRLSAELLRSSAEDQRIIDENQRLLDEISRGSAESIRNLAEIDRISNENARLQSEITRNSAELERIRLEDERILSESIRVSNEILRPDFVSLTYAEYQALSQDLKDSDKYFYKIIDDNSSDPDNIYVLVAHMEDLASAASISAGNALTSEQHAKSSEDLSKSWAIGETGVREGEAVDNSKYYKEVVAQAMADLLHMLGNSVATLDETGHLTPAQIPSLSINTVIDVANTGEMILLTAERGDVALIVTEGVVTESYILAADDPTILTNWKKLGVSYVANAGHAVTADNATNADMINNKRIIGMTQAQYDVAVLDPDTLYIVTP